MIEFLGMLALIAIWMIADAWQEKIKSNERIAKLNAEVRLSEEETLRFQKTIEAMQKKKDSQ